MTERKHSLKSDLIVGIGGLSLALAASYQECKAGIYGRYPEDNRGISSQKGEIKCSISSTEDAILCEQGVSRECRFELLEKIMNRDQGAGDEGFELPESCTAYIR